MQRTLHDRVEADDCSVTFRMTKAIKGEAGSFQ